MSEVTRILGAIEQGEPHAAEQLLPLVYDELRRLAAAQMAHEKPGQTLDATALVHEAYLRLVGPADDHRWENRGHFFAAAAEAMRRILVEVARRKKRLRHGSGFRRNELTADGPAPSSQVRWGQGRGPGEEARTEGGRSGWGGLLLCLLRSGLNGPSREHGSRRQDGHGAGRVLGPCGTERPRLVTAHPRKRRSCVGVGLLC
jgi:hypothetical protein